MKRDQELDLAGLALQLRDEGIPPGRDLWPAIEAAIDRQESARRSRRRPRLSALWPMAAAAAVIALLLSLESVPSGPGSRAAAPDQGIETLDTALAQLQAALDRDPGNMSVTRLLLMVHRTRGELLQRTPTSGQRAG
jgi:hypothetical protein